MENYVKYNRGKRKLKRGVTNKLECQELTHEMSAEPIEKLGTVDSIFEKIESDMNINIPEDVSVCCRTCLKTASDNMYNLFDDKDDYLIVAKILSTCTTVQLDAADNKMPKKLCTNCYQCLINFYDFKKVAEDTDKKLNERVNAPVKEENELKSENIYVKTELNELQDTNHDETNQTDSDDEVLYKKKRRKRLKWLNGETYTCPYCSQKFKYLSSYLKHNMKHSNECEEKNKVKCDLCTASFKSQNSLAAHKRKHVSKNRVLGCKFCGKIFKKLSHLKRHELCHDDNRPFKCSQCTKSYLNESDLIDHINYKHIGIRPHKCPICGKGFSNMSVLSNHVKLHTREKPYLCPTCGKRFDSSTNLKQHVSRHVGVKSFVCNLCPKKFVTKGELKSHKVTHTGVKPFSCEQCGATFTKNASLKKHSLTHLGVKPYKCESCPMKFTFKEHLKVHNRIHTGEKPYKCDHCDRTFTQSGDLLKHKRAYYGDHLYKCDECGEGFRLKSELRNHVSVHYISMKNEN